MGLRARRMVAGGAIGLVVLGGAGLAMADGGLRISPSSGPEGSSYDIDVDCATPPALANKHTQDGPEQGTIAAFVPDDATEIAPSTWRVTREADTTDEIWWAECDGTNVGQDRFDAESPHLWFGPRPSAGFTPLVGRTTVEGTDCPPGTTAEVSIGFDDVVITIGEVPIDAYGDWSVPLPRKVGDADLRIDASCGEVTYAQLTATSTSTTSTTSSSTSTSSTTTTTTTTAPPSSGPAPATPVRSTAGYTG